MWQRQYLKEAVLKIGNEGDEKERIRKNLIALFK
jgi:hypothetical protein